MTKIITLSRKIVLSLDFVFSFFAFLIPFSLNGPQLLTGTVVNSILYLAANKLDKKGWLIIAVLPSLGAFAHGVIFGPATIFLFYFLPFIWIGNLLMMYLFYKSKNIFIASGVKTVFLFLTANIYFSFHIVPSLFVTSMGLLQLITAFAGGLVVFIYERNRNAN